MEANADRTSVFSMTATEKGIIRLGLIQLVPRGQKRENQMQMTRYLL